MPSNHRQTRVVRTLLILAVCLAALCLTAVVGQRGERAAIRRRLPGIACWGDSLTEGAGGEGTSYPAVLEARINQDLLGRPRPNVWLEKLVRRLPAALRDELQAVPVANLGVGGETTNTILCRNGCAPCVTDGEATLPAGKEPVALRLVAPNGQPVAPLRRDESGRKGMARVSVAGVAGRLAIEQDGDRRRYFFTRDRSGEALPIPPGTAVLPLDTARYRDWLPVVFIGQNGGYADAADLVRQQRAIIDHQTANGDKYIVVGLHTGTAKERAKVEAAMEAAFGDRFVNLRDYMSTRALQDAGIAPTDTDRAAMAKGATPPSLLSDEVHFNAAGYRLLGELVFSRMDALGYFDGIKE